MVQFVKRSERTISLSLSLSLSLILRWVCTSNSRFLCNTVIDGVFRDTPMDYDGSDTQGHNLQLTGESRSKSSSVPRPYAFPRFDFEDSIQGNLRFDSLVESEVFLDIQSQEDNQWIEDFSRGSNVIEFSSNATESCSITRRNNVWSEATSLESVELLLKSVGQEQIVPKDTNIDNSNTSNELNDLKKMEPKFEHDNVNSGCKGISDASVPQNELLNDIPESGSRVERKLSQVEKDTISQVHLGQEHESSSPMRMDLLEEGHGAPVTEGDILLGTECVDKVEKGVQCIVHESMNRTEDSPSQNAVSVQDVNFNTRTLGLSSSEDHDNSHNLEGTNDLVKIACDDTEEQLSSQKMDDIHTNIMEQHKVDDAIPTDKVPSSLILSVECVDKEIAPEVIISAKESSAMSCTQESHQSQLLEDGDRDNSLASQIILGEGQADVLSPCGLETAALTGSDTLAGNSELQTNSNNLNPENQSISEPKMDAVLQLDQKSTNDKVESMTESSHKEGRTAGDVARSLSPSPLIIREDVHSAGIVDVAESFGFLVSSSSVELTKEIGGVESIGSLHDASPVIVDGFQSSDSSKDNFENEAALQLSDVIDKTGDVSLDTKKEENINTCADVIDKKFETCVAPSCDQRLGSSTMMGSSHDEHIVNLPHPDDLGKTEPETNLATCTRNNDHVEKENNEDMHENSFGRESSHADEVERRDAKISIGASSITLSRSDEVAAEVDSSCEAKFEAHHDSIASQHSTTEGELILVAEGILSTADPLGDACSSPTTISPDVQIPDERKQEGVGGSEFASKPSTSEDLKVQDISGDDNSFTFKVNSLPDAEKEKNNNWTPFPIAAMHKTSLVLEGVTTPSLDKIQAGDKIQILEGVTIPSVDKIQAGDKIQILEGVTTPNVDKIQARLSPEISGSSPGEHAHEVSKPNSGRRRRASGKGASKENSLTGYNGNETTPDKPSRKRANISRFSLTPGRGQPGQSVGLQPHTEQKRKKLSSTTVAPSCDLPDLNSSALKNYGSPSTVFQQSFTDLQQVQLRAQIFVYGSLIQGTTPDEACMVSAFGSSDRERGVWEPVWQAAMERGRSKISQSMDESPMNSYSSGAKVPEVADKQVAPQSKVFQSPGSRAVTNQTTILSPIVPLSSPLWSISTPYNDVSQLTSQQRRPILDYQPAVSRLHSYQIPPVRNMVGLTTWPSQATCSPSPWISQTPVLSVNAPFTNTNVSEKMKLTPLKDLSLPAPSCVKDAPSTPLVPTGGSNILLEGSSHVPDQTKSALPSELPFADPKPRKRKKPQASNDIPQNSLLSHSRSEPIAASPLPTPAPLSPVTTSYSHVTTSMPEVSPACITPQPQVGRLGVGTSSACSEETSCKVTNAKLQAEEAAVSAATAISHCESLWGQLAKQVPGTSQETEAKIAAAAGAAVAAVCVAKAAAAAARVASNAALQAKLMADEALGPSKMAGGIQSEYVVSNVQGVGSATPASILTGDGGSTQSSSILVAAREAAKRRIEAASAAAKQAENLDAIIKAAELAAEAVSQAGKIVAMGDPLPLKALINAGPEGYWKLSQGSPMLVTKSGNGNKEQNSADAAVGAVVSGKENSAGPSGFEEKEIMDQGKSHEVSDIIEGNSSVDVSAQCDHEELSTVQGNIKEGSIVEVYKDNDGLKPAWFSANVLTVQDGKAFVHYTSLLSREGRDSLKEWVALEGEEGKAPRVRPALPNIGSHWQNTKKRRRSAMGNYSWTVRDMVDVSFQDSWWEGIVTEQNAKDETTLTVHFPARGETSAVSVLQLRPSRIWSNGSWVEWSRLRGHENSTESDTPLEKRPRLQSPSRSSKEKNQLSDGAELVAGKPEPSKLQTLTADDKVFNIGKSSKAETRPDVRRTLRTGLQKEKSRVVFGVPKPGKKQKFMEVSKHFSTNQNRKDNETKDPVKFAKYLIPQRGAATRGRKIQPRVDSKETQAPKASSSKARSVSSRTVSQKGNYEGTIHGEDVEKSAVIEENTSNIPGSSSVTDAAAERPLSSLFANQLDKKSSLNAKTELLNKRKQGVLSGPLTKIDEEKATADASEPRRSHRRFQPTHRLLEGLQSSLVIPKMPKISSVSQDKGQGQKSRVRSVSTRAVNCSPRISI
ncbi:hypothetical protein V2J09_002628 [Rumex salicifolius]